MRWLSRMFGADDGALPAPTSRDPASDFWYGPVSRRVAAGVPVTVETARRVPVVRDCLQVLSTTIAGLSRRVYERTGDGQTRLRPRHPVAQVFEDPNPEQSAFEFVANIVNDCASHGNFFAEIEPGERGALHYLWPLDPETVTVERLPDRTRRYIVRDQGVSPRVLLPGEIWHIPVPPLRDRLVGCSPITEGADAIGAAIAIQEYAASFFKNDATPPFWFKHKTSFKDAESKRNFLEAATRALTGSSRHKPGVLEFDMDVVKLGATNEEAQFLETRKEIALEITRIWRMPPHKVGILDRATFSNIEHQSLEFVVDTLGPWIELIEASVRKHLIRFPDLFGFEFNVSSLLRGDVKARFEAYATARQWGWMSVNEIRRLERMNPIGPAGDRYIEPLNMAPAGSQSPPPPEGETARALMVLRETAEREARPARASRPHLRVIDNVA